MSQNDNALIGEDKLHVTVNEAVCVGCGTCVFIAPDVFTQRDEDGMVELLDAHPPASARGLVEEAVVACPADVIQLTVTRAASN